MREGCTYKKLGEVASFSRGLTYSKGDVAVDSSKKVLRSNNINLATHSLNFDDVACLKEEFVIPVEKMLQQNDIFVCMSNGSTQHLGKVAFIDKKMNYAFGGFMGAIHPKVNDIFPKYAFYFCLSSEYRRLLASVLNGININNLKWSDLSKFPIPVPPLSEQQRVVNELDLLSSIIEKKKSQLKEYDQLAQSIFYDMFGDPVTNEKGWMVNTFGNIASFKNGINYHPKNEGYSIKCIGVGDFQDRRELRDFNLIRDLTIDEVIDESYYLKDGDIILVRSNGSKELVGRNMIVYPQDKKVTYSGFCIRCRLNSSSILPVVLNRILSDRGTMMVLRQEGRGCNISNINQKKLSSLPIIIPPLSLQQSFASKIEAIERQKALVQQSINEAETLFNSRMDYYFN